MLDQRRAAILALPPKLLTKALCEALMALPPDAQIAALKQLRTLVDTTPSLRKQLDL